MTPEEPPKVEVPPLSADELARLEVTLEALARSGRTATYNELATAIGLEGRHRIHRLTLALEASLRYDHSAGRPLRAAVAVSRMPPCLPGRGFFLQLRALGRYHGAEGGPQAEAVHRAELARLFAARRGEADEGGGADKGGRAP